MTRSVLSRGRLSAAAALTMLTLAAPPAPSARPQPQLFSAPPAADLAAFDAWLAGASDASDDRGGIVTPADLAAALAHRPRQIGFVREDALARAERIYLDHLPFGSSIRETAARHRLDGVLVASVVWAESKFSPRAVSPRGAVGLMQVMPATAARLGVSDLRDPQANLEAGCRYLRSLIDAYGGDLSLALAAYNAGPAVVARYDGIPPFRETRHYVARVLARYDETRGRVEAQAVASRDPFLPTRVALGGALPAAARAAR
jgi:soluble lytic murein transglycosylase-like protein